MEAMFLTSQQGLFDAMRLAADVDARLDLQRAKRIGELRDFSGPVLLDCLDSRSRLGIVEGFFLLRHILGDAPKDEPTGLAIIGIQEHLFADPQLRIPAAERVRYFPIPLDLHELFQFLAASDPPGDRAVTRRLLRAWLDQGEIERIAGGDRHPIRHFSALSDALENALDFEARDAFCRNGSDEMRGLWFTNDLLSARAMLDAGQEHLGADAEAGPVAGLLGDLRDDLRFFEPLARCIDQQSGGLAISEAQWATFRETLLGLDAPSARAHSIRWMRHWQSLCQEIAKTSGRTSPASAIEGE